ncbi:MAG: C40 family peptidase [Aestuariivirga sp.]|nr:C40 family peptidase [Aestuariivirga sp.]
MNIDSFIGLPYRDGARGPDAYDCYGIVAAVLKAVKGLELPDWHAAAATPQAASRAIAAALAGEVAGGRVLAVVDPADWDIAIVGSTFRPHHVGVFFGGGVLHASRAFGSVWHPLNRFRLLYPHTEFYRWHR